VIRRPWAIVFVLTGLNLVNYIDRYMVSAMGPDIIRELHLSDFEFGLVWNAFMVGYFVTSPFFGALGDRGPRRGLIALGVALWSLATIGSGYMPTLIALLAMRFVVGTGEASYATLAPTIIDDLAPPAKKNRWLSVFYVAIPVGAALGFVLGGMLAKAFGWRHAFVAAGAPGLVLALACLAIAEPARKPREKSHWRRDLGALLARPIYVDAVAGYVAYTAALGAFSHWAPTYLHRRFDMPTEKGDFWFGVVLVVTGLVGTFVGGVVADRGADEHRLRRCLQVCAVASGLGAVFALVSLLLPSAVGFFVAASLAELALFVATSPVNVVILGAVAPELRASAMAVSIFAIHAFGDLISPPLVGAISDHSSIKLAMAVILPTLLAAGAWRWHAGARRALAAA
jgi:MFS family permease